MDVRISGSKLDEKQDFLVFRKYSLKYLWVRGHEVCKLLSSSSEKNNIPLTQREQQKCDKKTLIIIGVFGDLPDLGILEFFFPPLGCTQGMWKFPRSGVGSKYELQLRPMQQLLGHIEWIWNPGQRKLQILNLVHHSGNSL